MNGMYVKGGQKMYNYSVVKDGYEGMDYIFKVKHEKKFTREEFNTIVEEAILYAVEKHFEEYKFAYIDGIEGDKIFEYLQTKGFVENNDEYMCYSFGADCSNFKNEKLIQWEQRESIYEPEFIQDINIKPKYLQGDNNE